MELLNVQLTLNLDGSITANWSPITGTVRYTVYMFPIGKTYCIVNERNVTTTSYTSPANLEHNQQYQVNIAAHDDSGVITSDGGKVLIRSGFYDTTPLTVPENIKATASTISATISFDEVRNARSYDILFDGEVYNTTGTSKKFTDLQPKTSYTYAVRAKNERYTTAYSAVETITTLARSMAVPNNIRKNVTGTSATITWGAVSTATSYDIQFNGVTYNVSKPSKTITGLTSGTSYTFKIRAKNADTTSEYTSAITLTTLKAPASASAKSTENSVTINWSAVTGASGYTMWFNGKLYNIIGTTRTFTGLNPNTSYTYQIRAQNGDGLGVYNTAQKVKTTPKAPADADVSTNENSATVSWSEVTGATGYDVLFNNTVYSVTQTYKTITGLSANTSYTYQVRVKNANGSSSYCTAQTVKTTPKPPSNPTVKAIKYSVTVSWSPISGATSYDILINGITYRTEGTSKTISGLTPGTKYTCSVRANNADGSSSYSISKTVTTIPDPPGVPTNVSATAALDSVTVTWSAVNGATGYDVYFNGTTYNVTGTAKVITGLNSGTSYSYKVRAKNDGGVSTYSAAKTITTLVEAPRNAPLILFSYSHDTITLRWSKVDGATSYDICFNATVYNVTGTSKTFTGLTPDTNYTFKGRSRNSGGVSTYSGLQTLKTLVKPPVTPTNVTAEATANTLKVSWDKVSDATSYEILVNGTVYSTTGGTKLIVNLTPGTCYTYAVRARNAGGRSAYSAEKTIYTLLNTPENVTATATVNSVIVYWDSIPEASGYDVEFNGIPYAVTDSGTITRIEQAEPVDVTVLKAASVMEEAAEISYATDNSTTGMYKKFVGLKPNTRYPFRVRAKSTNSASTYSATKTIITESSKSSCLPHGKNKRTYPDGKVAYTGIDPVNAVTGAFLWSYTWLEELGKDKLHFTTMYDSQREEATRILGSKWNHSLNYLLNMDDNKAYFTTPYDDVITFRKNAEDDSFQMEATRFTYTLEKKEDGCYSVKALDGTEYLFDKKLCLNKIMENGVIAYQFQANEVGEIVQIEGRYGGCLKLTYTDGCISQVTDAMGNKVTFSYKDGKLVSVVNPDKRGMSFAYDDEANLLTISDFTGKEYLTNQYDMYGRVIEQYVVGRGKSQVTYDGKNKVTIFTDELGNATKHYYNNARLVTSVELAGTRIRNSYNESGQMTARTDALGNITKMEYDNYGRMNHVIHPDGTEEQVVYNDRSLPIQVINRDGTETVYRYDKNNNLTAVQDERGNTAFYEYDTKDNLISYTDKNNNVWTYFYDENNHLKQAKNPEGNIYHYTHDAIGRLTAYTSPEGRTISYQYDSTGDLLRMEDADGAIVFEYNENGSRTGITDKMGNKQRLEYNELGQISLATDFMGQEHYFFYDAKGNLIKETDPLGNSVSYAYDAFGNNTAWTDKNGNTTTASFDAANQLTEVKNAAGGSIKYTYDTMGQVKTVTDPLNHKTAYTYDKAGRILTETDALGNSISYTYDKAGNLLTRTDQEGVVIAYTYDNDNKLLSIRSDAGAVSFTYDKLGRVIAVQDMLGNTETAIYDGDGNLTAAVDKESNCTTYVYDKAGRVIEATAPNGGKTEYVYDKNGNCTKVTDAEGNTYTYTYDANNRIIQIKDPLEHAIFYEYDAVGQLLAVTDANGGKTTFAYDANGNIIQETNPLGGIKKYAYDCLNRLTESVDEEGYKRSFVYDAAGNMTSYTDANENQWSYAYDAANRLTTVTDRNGDSLTLNYTKTGKVAKVTDAEGAETSYLYDSMGRLVKMSDALEHSLSFTYDGLGRVLTQTDANGNVTIYDYSPTGNLLSVTDGEGNTTTYTYNELGQMLTATDALGSTTSYTYNALGQVTAIRDAMGEETTFTYNAKGQIATVTDAKGGTSTYTYDACGNLTEVTNPLGNIVHYEYDAMNNQIKECLSESGEQTCATIYQYDKRGCMVKEITALSQEKTYTYDGNGNFVTITDEEDNQTTVRYDLNNRPVQMNYSDGRQASFRYNKRGELVEMKDWNGTVVMERDTLGRLTKVTDHNGYITGYTYDAAGNKIGISYPDGSMVGYTYDKNHRLIGVRNTEAANADVNANEPFTTYGYDPVGNLLSIRQPGGRISYTYNANRQPINIKYRLNDGTSMEESFSYDALGHIIGSRRKGSSTDFTGSAAYTYDAMGRLITSREGQNTEAYAYDALGNRIRRMVNGSEKSTCQYNALNQLIAMTENGIPYSYSYDKRGNLTEERRNGSPIRQYTYDATNHLVLGKNLESGEQTEYLYNALYMRVGNVQTLAGKEAPYLKETSYVADYLSRPCNDLMAYEKGGITTRAIYGRGYELLGQKVMVDAAATPAVTASAMGTTAQVTYFQSDLLGSPLLAANEQGELLRYAPRNVWGDLTSPLQGAANSVGLEDSFRFTNYYHDTVIGKYFAQARFYDSTQGRMLSKDPIKRGLNPYPYCDNDPVNYVDPTGEVANILLGGGIGGLIGGVSGFVSSAVSQLTSGQGFSMKKALGSAANGAVVGAVQGALVSSGAGLVTSLISNFAAGTAGNALEQGIGTGRVNVAESITSGATNAVSNLIYGNAPLKNVKSAFLRGAGSGAATSAINSLSNNLAFRDTDKDSTGAGLASVMASGMTIPYVKARNPRTMCEVSKPFDSRCGYQNTYGYQYEVRPISMDTNTNSKKGGFNLGRFIKDVTIGAVTGGLSSVAFYGAGKAVDALKDGVRNRGVGSKSGRETELFLPDEYYQRLDDNIANAIAARDAEIARLQSLSKTQQSNIATVVAGVDIRTGDVYVGVKNSRTYKGNATCAEDIVFRGLGGNTNANIIMTPAIRPRNSEVIPVCTRCQTKYPQNQFVKGTTFQ